MKVEKKKDTVVKEKEDTKATVDKEKEQQQR